MIVGKGNISAQVVADSIANDTRITTMSLNYPRFIHSEFMTHRMFSRNASSSRAIPVEKLLQQVEYNPAMPIHWGKNQPGMQAREECTAIVKPDWCGSMNVDMAWQNAAADAAAWSGAISDAGYHKQVVNRITEPYQFIKVVVTATEWDNFFKLRLHPDAQPEIMELARVMKEAMKSSEPRVINLDDPIPYHMPFISVNDLEYWGVDEITTEDLLKASIARCARVSYMNHDGTSPDILKDIQLYERLYKAGHLSPFEHVATPMVRTDVGYFDWWDNEHGVSHIDRTGKLWSGNFKGWVQYRQLLKEG